MNERALYIDDGDILTSAGTAASIDLRRHFTRYLGTTPSAYRRTYQGAFRE
ncbi:hypothetical protein [Nonomuraea jabiensis]|uniref:hypothetical protein n=1 Tax=Nonomuraea jabiensis TaxID=882448 RepID=UPI003D72E661